MSRLAQIAIVGAACLLGSREPSHAQRVPETDVQKSTCLPSELSDSCGPKISITEVTFSGARQIPIEDEQQIAASIKSQPLGKSLNAMVDEASERARAGWQDRGYFNVKISSDSMVLSSTPTTERIALSIYVVEGLQYKLGGIKFKGNRAISNERALRDLFRIPDGDIFSRERMASGLDKLREAYAGLGYINFTSVPETRCDNENKLIFVQVEVDEGKQFYVSSIDMLGLDEGSQRRLLQQIPIKRGDVFNGRLFNLLLKEASTASICAFGSQIQMIKQVL